MKHQWNFLLQQGTFLNCPWHTDQTRRPGESNSWLKKWPQNVFKRATNIGNMGRKSGAGSATQGSFSSLLFCGPNEAISAESPPLNKHTAGPRSSQLIEPALLEYLNYTCMCTVRVDVHFKVWQTDQIWSNMNKHRLNIRPNISKTRPTAMAHQTNICLLENVWFHPVFIRSDYLRLMLQQHANILHALNVSLNISTSNSL